MNPVCYLCSGHEFKKRKGVVRDDPTLAILECESCGLVFLHGPKKSPDFYEKSGMHGDSLRNVEEWLRECEVDDRRRSEYLGNEIDGKDVLDFGCGAGGFALQIRDRARSVAGIELEERLRPHFDSRGLEVFRKFEDLPATRKFDLITAFHVVEHLENPADVLAKMAKWLKPGGKLLVEVPSAADALLTLYECEAFSKFTYWSCHLYLFSPANIEKLAKKSDLELAFVEGIQRYPLSNHLYWLAKGKPGGHETWTVLNDAALSETYKNRLVALGKTDTIMIGLMVPKLA